MYVILVNNDNTMSATQKQRIMQRSKLVDDLWFLVNPIYNSTSIEDCIVLLEYLLPVSRKYKSEILSLSLDRYEEYLKYVLPLDTELTSEAGSVEIQLTFLKADLDTNGNPVQKVRKIDRFTIDVLPISKWADVIPDSALSPIDQRLIKMDAQLKHMEDINNAIYAEKADNIIYDKENNSLQLMSGNKMIGNVVNLECENMEDGLPIVNFSEEINDDDHPVIDKEIENVVEF